jgi:hypothetical protein
MLDENLEWEWRMTNKGNGNVPTSIDDEKQQRMECLLLHNGRCPSGLPLD